MAVLDQNQTDHQTLPPKIASRREQGNGRTGNASVTVGDGIAFPFVADHNKTSFHMTTRNPVLSLLSILTMHSTPLWDLPVFILAREVI